MQRLEILLDRLRQGRIVFPASGGQPLFDRRGIFGPFAKDVGLKMRDVRRLISRNKLEDGAVGNGAVARHLPEFAKSVAKVGPQAFALLRSKSVLIGKSVGQ